MLGAVRAMTAEHDLVWLMVLGEHAADGSVADANVHPGLRPIAARSDVRELYSASDLFLSCTRGEGPPCAVLEALACGLAVVGTDLPPQRRLLDGLPATKTVPNEPIAIAERFESSRWGESTAPTMPPKRANESKARTKAWARRLVDLYAEATTRQAPRATVVG